MWCVVRSLSFFVYFCRISFTAARRSCATTAGRQGGGAGNEAAMRTRVQQHYRLPFRSGVHMCPACRRHAIATRHRSTPSTLLLRAGTSEAENLSCTDNPTHILGHLRRVLRHIQSSGPVPRDHRPCDWQCLVRRHLHVAVGVLAARVLLCLHVVQLPAVCHCLWKRQGGGQLDCCGGHCGLCCVVERGYNSAEYGQSLLVNQAETVVRWTASIRDRL